MERFLHKRVLVNASIGLVNRFSGTFTSYDDEFICLDNNTYIARKYIISITIL